LSTLPYWTNRLFFCPFSLSFCLFTQITVKALLCILSGFFLNSLYTKFKFVHKVFLFITPNIHIYEKGHNRCIIEKSVED